MGKSRSWRSTGFTMALRVGPLLALAIAERPAAAEDAAPPATSVAPVPTTASETTHAAAAPPSVTAPAPPPPPALPEKEEDDPPRAPQGAWYGYQTLAVDALGLTMVGVATGNGPGNNVPLLSVGLGVYLLGPPAVHALHRDFEPALDDLALRVFAPLGGALVGFLVGLAAQWAGPGYTEVEAGAIGVAAGTLTAVAIDAVALAQEPAPKHHATTVRWSPQVNLAGRGGGTVGVGGSF
jgi:hypothetical protein